MRILQDSSANLRSLPPGTETKCAALFSIAKNSCEEQSVEAEGTSLKSEVSRGGKWLRLHTAASFEATAYRAAQSFTLLRAVSITADWLGKSLGRHHKKKAEKGREGGGDCNRTLTISVCDNMKKGGTGKWRPPAVENMAYLSPAL